MASIKPKVSIITPTFNQIKFIRQTIESILSQNTKFSFEILIHDDASNDGTADIIKEFENKYPEIVKPIYAKSNRFSRADYKYFNELFSAAKGEYIAMCEGDDYWTDNNKLQTQVDYMERYPSTTVCFHPVEVVYEDGRPSTIFPEKRVAKEFTKTNLFKRNYIQTNSVMYRRADYSQMLLNFLPIDWYLHLYHVKSGRMGFINKVMSAYRVHSGGIWSESYTDLKMFWHHQWRNHLLLYIAMMKLADTTSQRREVNNNFYEVFNNLLHTCSEEDCEDIRCALEEFPKLGAMFVMNIYKEMQNLENKNTFISERLGNSLKDIDEKNALLNIYEQRLVHITSSKSWVITKPLRSLSNGANRIFHIS